MMKRSILVSLSALTLSLVTTPALAEEVAAVRKVSTNNIVEITPFNLVRRGYQGYLTNQGIPSNGAFLGAVHTRRVTAVDLVEGAIASGRLAPETLDNRGYINSVQAHLNNLDND